MEIKFSHSDKVVSVSDQVFNKDFNEPLIHQIVTAYMAGARAGTKAQKTRAEVSGGGIKPWRQKGTGRARAGTIRSPIWRTGGVTFAAKPRSYKQKTNRKMFRGAMCSILSELNRQNRLILVEALHVDTHKTKAFIQLLHHASVQPNESVLVVTESPDENLYLASRNLFQVTLVDVTAAISDPVSFIRADKVLLTEAVLKAMERDLQ